MWSTIKGLVIGGLGKLGIIDFKRCTFSVRVDVAGPDLYPDTVREFSIGGLAVRAEIGEADGEHFAELSGCYTDTD